MERPLDLEDQRKRKLQPWLTVREWNDHVLMTANVFHFGFWRHILRMWKGDRLWALRFWLRHPVRFWWMRSSR